MVVSKIGTRTQLNKLKVRVSVSVKVSVRVLRLGLRGCRSNVLVPVKYTLAGRAMIGGAALPRGVCVI